MTEAFRDHYPAAWMFHHNTVRWPHNTLEPDEAAWPGAAYKEHIGAPMIALPQPNELLVPLGAAIRRRVSCRRFSSMPLTLADTSALLSFAYGVEGTAHLGAKEHLERPVPSGGGLYPLELYLLVRNVEALGAGVYHYAPLFHALEQLQQFEFSHLLTSQLFMNQLYVSNASMVVLLTACVERTMHKYGDRGYRYIMLEAGHVAQNMCLVAAGTGLAALPLGGFFDTYLAEYVGIDLEEELILYGLALGHPATEDRVDVRNIASQARFALDG